MIPLILQNPRRRDFYGPDDYEIETEEDIAKTQKEWDTAYNSLSFTQKIRYNIFGYWE